MAFHSYSPADGHGLKHNPFKALISPRPIGWISSRSSHGVSNLAPYSFFNALSESPPLLGFSSSGRKDSLRNIEAAGVFVHNVAGRALVEQMNASSAPYGEEVSEIEAIGLKTLPGDVVDVPRLADAPASFECKLVEIKQLEDHQGAKLNNYLIIGEVVRAHIQEQYIADGMIDETAIAAVGRLGYFNYAAVKDIFALARPTL
ncbi:flavin reductase family protein [Maritalea mediterranea]|uniref:Flavin reductase family protein n=1 Tax=Maritalea mediterranea TaxID=2909667 RepID=A0ABS9E9T6_9HYPH|nr:flavin reductase family protein [Maritalea mediterranea]